MPTEDDKKALLSQLTIERDDRAPASNSPSWWGVAGGVAIGLCLGAAAAYWILPSASPVADSKASAAQNLETAPNPSPETPVKRANANDIILNASGYVVPRLVATVSSEVMGRILTVEVEEGTEVSPGQVLATLDDTVASVNARLAQAQYRSQAARLRSLQTQAAEAQRVLKRQLGLKAKDLTSEAELTRAQAAVDQLRDTVAATEADVEVARLRVATEQERLDDHTIRAPFAGVVVGKNAQPGEIVAPSSAGGGFTRTGICTIVDMESLEIDVDVNEAYIGRVKSGQSVIANLDAYPDWDIPAEVVAVIPTANRAKATVRVRIAILQRDARILPEMGVKVAFLAHRSS